MTKKKLKKNIIHRKVCICKNKLKTSAEEFDVDEDASTAKIRTAFKKFATSKKNNKTLLTNFGKAVA